MDPVVWSRLPDHLVEKICNMIPRVQHVNAELMKEIRFQPKKYAWWYYNTLSLFGAENVYWIMYDDLRNVLRVEDTLPAEMPLDLVVETMWKGLSSEDRDALILES